jgi:hypothetical protein
MSSLWIIVIITSGKHKRHHKHGRAGPNQQTNQKLNHGVTTSKGMPLLTASHRKPLRIDA